MTILVGTASWTDKTLIACGRFYPQEASAPEGRLRYYASQFPMVEVDSSYYAMPAPATAQRGPSARREASSSTSRRSGSSPATRPQPLVLPPRPAAGAAAVDEPNFYYNGRAGRAASTSSGGASARRCCRCARPASSAWCTSSSRPGCCATATATPTSSTASSAMDGFDGQRRVPPRHAGSTGAHAATTLAFERELGVVHTRRRRAAGLRQQRAGGLGGDASRATRCVRLHGRNRETWNIKGATVGVGALQLRLPRRRARGHRAARRAARRPAMQTHVVLNNNMEDQGQRNARR